MSPFKPLLLIIALTATLSFVLPGKQKATTYFSSFENVLGTSFDMKVSAINSAVADKAESVALDEIDRLSSVLSSYDPTSEFSIWQATSKQPVKVSDELYEVLELFSSWKMKTNGALNPAAGELINTWKKAEKNNRLPDRVMLQHTVQKIGEDQWILDPVSKTATRTGDASLVMNSFVKSYIINKVAEKVAATEGIGAVMVNIGGDMVIKGEKPETIHLEDPVSAADNTLENSSISISKGAVATSGNYKRGFLINGNWYSHILDPKTGLPADKVRSVTVIAPNATDAGALATAFNIMDPEAALALAETTGAAFKMILANGEVIKSSNWQEQMSNGASKKITAEKKAKEKEWDKNHEVAIQLELAKFEGRFRRPFVAVWVEDAKKNTVRTLALWYNKPRWLPDLKEWYRKNNARYNGGAQDMSTISSATRPAGNYILKWDGKDDKGKWLNEGDYTIHIEVAREHGTYQIMKQEVKCRKKPERFEIPGNIEVSSASVEYKKAN